MPAPLLLTLGGFGVLALAGLLDDYWHSHFGLDETGWSTPHAMIGWGLLLVLLGFLSCLLALRAGRPPPAFMVLFLGWIAVAALLTPLLGPLATNQTLDTVRAIASIPVLAAQPPAQHTYRIYLAWDLTRTNPLLAPLGAFWAGLALALLRRIDRRPWVLPAVAGLWTLLTFVNERGAARALDAWGPVSAHPAAWLPLPLLPAALAFLLLNRVGVPERLAWAGSGAVFSGCALAVWGPQSAPLALVVLAAGACVLGALLGGGAGRIIMAPAARTVPAFLALGILVPLGTGLIDLYLRHVTP